MTPERLYGKFIDTTGTLHTEADHVTVELTRRCWRQFDIAFDFRSGPGQSKQTAKASRTVKPRPAKAIRPINGRTRTIPAL
ncbi:MAG TPA: hypothetical protein VG226_15240, partial [Acidimicrobiales bacterium]|nr:hypothetical protein [Acidimicrobiales bacterium]